MQDANQPTGPVTEALHLPRYQFKQRTLSLMKLQQAFEVTNPETKEKLFFGKRDRLWLKRDVKMFYGQDDKGPNMMLLKDNSIFDRFGSFTIFAPEGQVLGHIRRKFWRSFFLKETWEIFDADYNMFGKIQYNGSLFKTWFRKLRVLSIIPIIGPILAMLMRLQFEYVDNNGVIFADFKRKASLRDFYILNFTESNVQIDRRIMIGMSVLLDAAEGR